MRLTTGEDPCPDAIRCSKGNIFSAAHRFVFVIRRTLALGSTQKPYDAPRPLELRTAMTDRLVHDSRRVFSPRY